MSALDVKKHGGLDRSWRLSCRALLSVFASNEGGHDIQGGSRGHAPCLPALDGPAAHTASVCEFGSSECAGIHDGGFG